MPKSLASVAIGSASESPSKKNRGARFFLVAAAITLSAVIQSIMAIHLLTILQAQGIKMKAAVTLRIMVGPSQVLARLLEMIIGRHFHPIWTMSTSTGLVTTGLVLLSFHLRKPSRCWNKSNRRLRRLVSAQQQAMFALDLLFRFSVTPSVFLLWQRLLSVDSSFLPR